MQELMDPRGDMTCGVCNRQLPASEVFTEDVHQERVCLQCLVEYMHGFDYQPSEGIHPQPFPREIEERGYPNKPPEPEPPYPHGAGFD